MSQSKKLIDLTPVSKIRTIERPELSKEQKEINLLKKNLKTNLRDIKLALKALIHAVPESVQTLTPLTGRTSRKMDDIVEMLSENNRYFERISELKSPKEMEE